MKLLGLAALFVVLMTAIDPALVRAVILWVCGGGK